MKLILVLFTMIAGSFAFAQNEKLMLDTAASELKWAGSKEFVDGAHSGTVAIQSGYVEMAKGEIVGGEIVIDMTKMTNTDLTDEGYRSKLIGHLQSEDFFDTQKHPTATFKIKKAKGNKALTGDLTIKNKTQSVTIPATVEKTGDVYTAKGKTSIDRTKFDVQYNSKSAFPNLVKTGKDKVIKNMIDLEFNIKTVAAAAAPAAPKK